jgi:hypothetical protein
LCAKFSDPRLHPIIPYQAGGIVLQRFAGTLVASGFIGVRLVQAFSDLLAEQFVLLVLKHGLARHLPREAVIIADRIPVDLQQHEQFLGEAACCGDPVLKPSGAIA